VRERTERGARDADSVDAVRGIHNVTRWRIPGSGTACIGAPNKRINPMLYMIAVVLLLLWLLGLVTSTTMGGFIHILLVIAIVMVLLRVISGRNAV
jgi:hypothetical protein